MENATDVISFKAQKNYALNGKIMLCSVIILFVALFLILSLHGHACWFFDCYRRRRPSHLPSLSSAASNSSSGLDAVVISSIPTFVYSADRHKPPLVCAICISEFEKEEAVRVLPKCNHTFHVDCIDMWFYSHSNCPLCRASVQSVITPETSS